MKVTCTIAHISDLHNVTDNIYLAKKLKQHFSNLKPSIIVASGDLAEHPFPWQLFKARKFLLDLAKTAGINETELDTRLIVIPGNHDYCFFGNFGFSLLTGLPYKLIFKRWNKRFIIPHKDFGLVFFRFDSNPLLARFAKGSIGYFQIKKFRKELKSYEADSTFQELKKISVVHHHPSPIIHAKKLEKFLELKNASRFLRLMAESGVSIILHGHKHFASTSVLRLGLVAGGEAEAPFHEVTVLSAGTTLKPEAEGPPGNHFNVIRIFHNGRVTAQSFFAKPREDFQEAGEPRTIPSIDSFFDRSLEREKERAGLLINRIVRSTVVDEEGNCNSTMRVEKLTPLSEKIDVMKHVASTTSGSVQYLKILAIQGQISHQKTRISNKEMKVNVHLPQTKSPVSYNLSYIGMNAFAMNRLEFKRKYPDREDWTESCLHSIKRPVLGFAFQVQLPKTLRLDDVPKGLVKCLATNQSADWLRRLVEHHLYYDTSTNTISFTLRKPPCGYQYGVEWTLPAQPDRVPPYVEQRQNLQANSFIEALHGVLKDSQNHQKSKMLTGFMEQFAEVVRKQFEIDDPSLDINVFYLNPQVEPPILRQALGNTPPTSSSWDYTFEVGDGNVGLAFKRNKLILYINEDTTGGCSPPYLLGRDRNGVVQTTIHRVLWSIPMRHPQNNDLVIGILNIGSFHDYILDTSQLTC